jgi:hypothetical protein
MSTATPPPISDDFLLESLATPRCQALINDLTRPLMAALAEADQLAGQPGADQFALVAGLFVALGLAANAVASASAAEGRAAASREAALGIIAAALRRPVKLVQVEHPHQTGIIVKPRNTPSH